MKEPITTIEGWTCNHYPENARGAVRQDGRGVLLHQNGALSGADCYVPAAVLAWVIAPLLDRSWAQGRQSGVQALADQPAPTETAPVCDYWPNGPAPCGRPATHRSRNGERLFCSYHAIAGSDVAMAEPQGAPKCQRCKGRGVCIGEPQCDRCNGSGDEPTHGGVVK